MRWEMLLECQSKYLDLLTCSTVQPLHVKTMAAGGDLTEGLEISLNRPKSEASQFL